MAYYRADDFIDNEYKMSPMYPEQTTDMEVM